MNKNFITRILLILGYCIPFVFLAMNEDVELGSLWFYLVMIFAFGILCYACIKSKNYAVVIVGNVLSFASSCIFARNFQSDKWEYYFKPFLPNQLIIFETVIAFVIQVIFIVYHIKNKRGDTRNG